MNENATTTHDVSRRDFLKMGGLGAAGGVGVALGAGSLVACAPETAAAAVSEVELLYTCPIDGKRFTSYEAIQEHFKANHPQDAIPEIMTLSINGSERKVQIEPHWTLQETLQHALGLTGAKTMCDRGGCGSCTVLIDGSPALSCITLAIECEGRQIETVEGIAADEKWKPLFDEFVSRDGSQCGYCSPGQIVISKYIIEKYENPTEEQILQEMASNICRCGTYPRHAPAIMAAVEAMGGGN
jgi:xanthine dehydrogenase YagT iron-sulfur-binding subunit